MENLVDGEGEKGAKKESFGEREERENMEKNLIKYLNLTPYHESEDKTVMGINVKTLKGIKDFGKVRRLQANIQTILDDINKKYNVWAGIGGSHVNKTIEYDIITNDISRSGIIAGSLILLILLLTFRSVLPLVPVVLPLAMGLIWGFAFIPSIMEGLNLITAFLALIIFGMGVDYSIHLVKRFQLELSSSEPEGALIESYLSTGSSIIVSAFTTAVALLLLAFSEFRGFSEFGIISAISIFSVLAAMYLTLPSILIISHRLHLIKPKDLSSHFSILPKKWLTYGLLGSTALALIISIFFMKFDFNLRNVTVKKGDHPEIKDVRIRHKKVYSTTTSPGAVYLAKDIKSLDAALDTVSTEKSKENPSIFGRVRSIRQYAPRNEEFNKRIALIGEIKEQLQGSWIRHVKDEDRKRLIDDFKAWKMPDIKQPPLSEIPHTFKKGYTSKDGSGRLLLNIHPYADRKDGRNAMKFTDKLYRLKMPEGVIGPIGETAVFAEILWIVLSEAPWLSIFTFLGIFILVFINNRSVKETIWILTPLATGLILTFGVIAVLGININFFNIVVIPALLGMGVDDGVHYFRRWKEKENDTLGTQKEMFEPLTVTTITTMLGYSGMVFAHHPGIRSIGIFACIGLLIIWATSLFLLPGLLSLVEKNKGKFS